jgi:hypothetical protein
MKLKVDKNLSGGVYQVAIELGGFTQEEIRRMEIFGVPSVALKRRQGSVLVNIRVPINQIKEPPIVFGSEPEATDYIESVTRTIKQEMDQLRTRTDNFTGSQQVEI